MGTPISRLIFLFIFQVQIHNVQSHLMSFQGQQMMSFLLSDSASQHPAVWWNFRRPGRYPAKIIADLVASWFPAKSSNFELGRWVVSSKCTRLKQNVQIYRQQEPTKGLPEPAPPSCHSVKPTCAADGFSLQTQRPLTVVCGHVMSPVPSLVR